MTHLADAVGELLRTQTMRVHYLPGDPDRSYTARAPSLLAQLATAVATSNGGRGGHTVPGSRLPLDAGALDLWVNITSNVHSWAKELNVDRRTHLRTLDADAVTANEHWRAVLAPAIEPRSPLPLLPDGDRLPALGRLLRNVATAAASHDAIAAAIARRCWCGRETVDCGCWTHRIRQMLAHHTEDREIRGAQCPSCQAYSAVVERDRERIIVPAVAVRVAHLKGMGVDDLWLYRMCRACGAEGWLEWTTEGPHHVAGRGA